MTRSVRHADVYALPNLVRNGGLDYLEPLENGHRLPHFWRFDGLVPRAESEEATNSYDVVAGEEVTRRGDVGDYVRVFLLDNQQVSLTQVLVSDPGANALDFPVPLVPGTARGEVSEGQLSVYERLLSRSRDYTFGVSMRVLRGKVDVSIRFSDLQGDPIAEVKIGERQDAFFTNRLWRRLSGTLTPSSVPATASFVLQRVPGSDLAEVHLGHFQIVLGTYDSAPYTGDPSLGVIPRDAVVMVMGERCPPGFVSLEEPEGVPVPEDWLADDAEARVREGNFPIGSNGPVDPSALQGDPTHNRDGYQFRLTQDHTVPFESFDSRFGSATTGAVSHNPNVRSPGDEPDDEGTADHQHNVRDGGSVPANRQFKLCRRL